MKLMNFLRSAASTVVFTVFAGSAGAAWVPGDPYKMHYPQLPDPQGWDVNMTFPKVLADDWRCIETGPVNDIHFWFSFQQDSMQTLSAFLAGGVIHASVHADIPATPTSFSRPGPLLWEREFFVGSPGVTVHEWGTGAQGWFDPNAGLAVRPDHNVIWQANIQNILDPFVQQVNNIYWLDLSVRLPTTTPLGIGWKTSLQHFNDDAVWGDFPAPIQWHELRDPFTSQSLDLAFVITPEPSTLALAGVALILLRRKSN